MRSQYERWLDFAVALVNATLAERANVQRLRQRVNVKLGLPNAFRAQGAQSSVLGRGCRSDLYRRMGCYALRITATLARAKAPR